MGSNSTPVRCNRGEEDADDDDGPGGEKFLPGGERSFGEGGDELAEGRRSGEGQGKLAESTRIWWGQVVFSPRNC